MVLIFKLRRDEMEVFTRAEILYFEIGVCMRENVPVYLEERFLKKQVREKSKSF